MSGFVLLVFFLLLVAFFVLFKELKSYLLKSLAKLWFPFWWDFVFYTSGGLMLCGSLALNSCDWLQCTLEKQAPSPAASLCIWGHYCPLYGDITALAGTLVWNAVCFHSNIPCGEFLGASSQPRAGLQTAGVTQASKMNTRSRTVVLVQHRTCAHGWPKAEQFASVAISGASAFLLMRISNSSFSVLRRCVLEQPIVVCCHRIGSAL